MTGSNTLIGYCEAAGCRRQSCCNYFGEAPEPCGNCDNCLDQAPLIDGTEEARDMLAAVAQSGERFGAGHVIDMLRGAAPRRSRARGTNARRFGSGAARKKEEWQSLIRQMVAADFSCASTIMAVWPSPSGARTCAAAQAFFTSARPRPRSKARADAVALSDGGDPDLLAALKAVRLKLARERRVPAYVIFSDRTLIDMAALRPHDLDSFAQVNGVGAAKLKDFGKVFLSAIAAHG